MKIKKVLIVDDDKVSILLTEALLRKQLPNADIHIEYDGEEAIKYLEACGDHLPELVLLDIDMPKVDGFEFLNWHQKSPYVDKMEIVMLSLSSNSKDMERSLAYNAVKHYITKPLNQQKIEFIVKDF